MGKEEEIVGGGGDERVGVDLVKYKMKGVGD